MFIMIILSTNQIINEGRVALSFMKLTRALSFTQNYLYYFYMVTELEMSIYHSDLFL